MADKKRDILEFVEQMNFKQMIPTRPNNTNDTSNNLQSEKCFKVLICENPTHAYSI
jgi:hypothetical protein